LRLWRRKEREQDLDRELRDHLELEAEEHEETGMAPDQARYAAQRAFGNTNVVKEEVREMWGWVWIEQLWQDLRYSGRVLFKSPGFISVSVLSLALGIGATTTIFSVFESVFFNSVTAKDPQRVEHVEIGGQRVSYSDYKELSTDNPVFTGLAAYDETALSFRTGNDLEKITGDVISGNFFDVLGITPPLGRTFTTEESRPERQPRVVILSYGFWKQRFGEKASILGQVIELNRERFTIIGVLSKDYRSIRGYGFAPEVYVPLSALFIGDLAHPDEPRLELVARLKDGVSTLEARAAIYAMTQQWKRRYPTEDLTPNRIQLYPLTGLEKMRRDGVPVEVTLFFALLLLVAGLVLLIACANVAGLLLARGANRSREIAVRLALGAARYRLVRQLLTESLLLALLGAGAGMGIYLLASTLIDRVRIDVSVPMELHLNLDVHLLAFTTGLALAATLLSGLTPALQATKSTWNFGSHQIGAGSAQRLSLRRTLVIGQFAFTFVLLVSAALFLRSLARISHVDPGFDVRHLLTAEATLDPNAYPPTQAEHYFQTAIAGISRLPGVRSVSGSAVVPLGIEHWVVSMKAGDRIIQRVHLNSVTSGYFRTLAIPFMRGRDFEASDRAGSLPVAILNETFARKYLNNHAIGAQVLIPTPGPPPTFSGVQVIGVVADSKYGGLGEEPTPALYRPYSQEYGPLVLEVSTNMSPAGAMTAVREALTHLDPHAPIKLRLMRDRLAGALLPSQIALVLLGAIGSLGLVLAATGIYGVMAYSVSRRTPEIGVRLALGATRMRILRMILRDALLMVSLAMAFGLTLALLIAQPLALLLAAGVSVIDPFSYGAVGVVLGIIALIAALIPAWRASRVDPMGALRYE
jgi:predicted permease